VAPLVYFGLFALQHRGQESAGIATSDGNTLTVYRDMGLVSQVFNEGTLAPLDGHLGIGHVRYSTTGSNRWENTQPVYRHAADTSIALAHNGNLTNTRELAGRYGLREASTDSELMMEAIALEVDRSADVVGSLTEVLPTLGGAFSLVLMDQDRLIGVRDPHGFRPLCVGRLAGDEGWVLSSETAGLDIIGAHFVREVAPGELVIADREGLHSLHPFPAVSSHLCLFEFVYFARPDSQLCGRNVFGARHEMGRRLAFEHPAAAEVVVPVPESGIPAAQGYAAAAGIPYADGLVKNRYVGRTFIMPGQANRAKSVRAKLTTLPMELEGKKVLLVDDSIVRGTTTRAVVEMVREAGAREVYLAVSAPKIKYPCVYGIDMQTRHEFLARRMKTDDKIAEAVGADAVVYMTLDDMVAAVRGPTKRVGAFCMACMDGRYPTGDVTPAILKNIESERTRASRRAEAAHDRHGSTTT
jgi:amidophosphoribosyltransferase